MVIVIVHIQRFPWHSPRPGRSCSCRFQQQDVLLQGENLRASLVKTFQGDNYWRFDPRKKPHVHSKYPQVKRSPKHLKGHLGPILVYTSRPIGSIYICVVAWVISLVMVLLLQCSLLNSMQSIQREWEGLPRGDLSAAFLWKNKKNYFFKGDNYWRFSERWLFIGQDSRC